MNSSRHLSRRAILAGTGLAGLGSVACDEEEAAPMQCEEGWPPASPGGGGGGEAEVQESDEVQVRSLIVGDDGRVASTDPLFGDESPTLRVWDSADGRLLHSFEGDFRRLSQWHRDRVLWVSGVHVGLFDVGSGRASHLTTGHESVETTAGPMGIFTAAVQGDLVVTGADDGTVRVSDLDECSEMTVIDVNQAWLNAVAWGPEEGQVFIGTEHNGVEIYDADSGDRVAGLRIETDSARFLFAGSTLAVLGTWAVRCYDVDGWQLRAEATWSRGSEMSTGFSLSRDGAQLLMARPHESQVAIFDTATGELRTVEVPSPTHTVQPGPDSTFYTPHLDLGIIEWDLATLIERRRFDTP